ncbi:RNA polymerase sigma factor [Paenibacillus sp. DYY-L-2]|uniref:RNA polymerase sigma factor n=1 Tax=Paenibacillus sp. DYY-L-2 TaxID=3447013 RepID=UPI003F50971A
MSKPGQVELIADFVMKNKENFYRLAYSYCLNAEDALDIVQDSIHKAIKSDTLKDETAIKSWFYKIVVHTALDFLRRRKRVTVASDGEMELRDPGSEDRYRDLDLERALDELPAEYRSVVVLRYFEDLKIEEVAEVLGLNVNTAKTRLYKALKLLRVEMEETEIREVSEYGK